MQVAMSSRGPHRRKKAVIRRAQITERDVAAICRIISDARRPLKWGEIVSLVSDELGHTWTRQALERHSAIKEAYRTRRTTKTATVVDPAVILLTNKIAVLRQENERLEKLVETYQAMFVRYQHNAHARGIGPAELDRPLTPVERRRSDR